MALSARARAMVADATHHPCPRDRLDIIAGLRRARLPVFDAIVRFQEQFGGLEYRVPGTEIGFHLGIMPTWDQGIEGFEEEGRYFFDCGNHPVAQFPFYLDQDGMLYADPNVRYPIASSIEAHLESDAVLYEMYRAARSPLWPVGWRMAEEGVFDRGDRRLDARMHIPRLAEACDTYTTWWAGEDVRIQRAVYLDWDTGERDIVRLFAHSWRGVWAVRKMFAGIRFDYPDPLEGMTIVDGPDNDPEPYTGGEVKPL